VNSRQQGKIVSTLRPGKQLFERQLYSVAIGVLSIQAEGLWNVQKTAVKWAVAEWSAHPSCVWFPFPNHLSIRALLKIPSSEGGAERRGGLFQCFVPSSETIELFTPHWQKTIRGLADVALIAAV